LLSSTQLEQRRNHAKLYRLRNADKIREAKRRYRQLCRWLDPSRRPRAPYRPYRANRNKKRNKERQQQAFRTQVAFKILQHLGVDLTRTHKSLDPQKAAYQKVWRQNHPEQIKIYKQRHRRKKKNYRIDYNKRRVIAFGILRELGLSNVREIHSGML
jgi:hypothetical protein